MGKRRRGKDGRTDGLKTKEGRRKELRAINTKFTVASVRNDVNLEAKKRKKKTFHRFFRQIVGGSVKFATKMHLKS